MRTQIIRFLVSVFSAAAAAASFSAAAAGAGVHRELGTHPAQASTSYFFTTYEVSTDKTNISWVTCGHDQNSEGCYGAGNMGPFGRVCAVAGGPAQVVVADSMADGESRLYIYRQSETSTPSATLLKKVSVNIPASSSATCHMAVSGDFVYFGTSESGMYYQVNMKTGVANGASVCGAPASSITANGKTVVVAMTNCFATYDSNGAMQEDGGMFTDEFTPSQTAYRP